MLLIMGGYPSSGKSEFIKLVDKELFDRLNNNIPLCWINPKDFLIPEYDKLNEEAKRNANISAWEVSLELLDEKIKEDPSQIIIFDTAAASPDPIIGKIRKAKDNGHEIIYIFLASNPSECKERAGSQWIGKRASDHYFERFKNTIPILKSLSDKFIKVSNHGAKEDLRTEAVRFIDSCLISNS